MIEVLLSLIFVVLIAMLGVLIKISLLQAKLIDGFIRISLQIDEIDFNKEDVISRHYDGNPEIIYVIW